MSVALAEDAIDDTSARIILSILFDYARPESIVELGHAAGWLEAAVDGWLEASEELGIKSLFRVDGVDFNDGYPQHHFHYDLALCIGTLDGLRELGKWGGADWLTQHADRVLFTTEEELDPYIHLFDARTFAPNFFIHEVVKNNPAVDRRYRNVILFEKA
jgi:hypothetical protein